MKTCRTSPTFKEWAEKEPLAETESSEILEENERNEYKIDQSRRTCQEGLCQQYQDPERPRRMRT